jgi:hypothetical protein
MYIDRDKLFNELGKELGMTLSIETGAVVIKSDDGNQCWIECPLGSSTVLFHACIAEKTLEQASWAEQKMWLTLNGAQRNGGWIGFHLESKTVRFFSVIALAKADASILKDMFNFVADSTRMIKAVVQKTLKEAPIPENLKKVNMNVANSTLSKNAKELLSAKH